MPEASSGNGKVALRYGDGGELDLPVKAATEGSAGIEVTNVSTKKAPATFAVFRAGRAGAVVVAVAAGRRTAL